MNVIILVSVVSIGVSGVYGGSRTLTALAQQGYAPKVFTYIDRSGRPLFSVVVILLFGLLAYVNLNANGPEVFDWLLALSGLAALFTWGSICLAHIRFRSAWKYHGHSTDELPFKAIGGVYGSWLGLFLVVIVLIAQVRLRPGPNPFCSRPMSSLSLRSALTDIVCFSTALVLCRNLPGRRRLQRRSGILPVVPRGAGRASLLGMRLPVEARGLAAYARYQRRCGPARA